CSMVGLRIPSLAPILIFLSSSTWCSLRWLPTCLSPFPLGRSDRSKPGSRRLLPSLRAPQSRLVPVLLDRTSISRRRTPRATISPCSTSSPPAGVHEQNEPERRQEINKLACRQRDRRD